MATTTTYALIREQIIAKIMALSPTLLGETHRHFCRAPRRYSLRSWAKENPAASLRMFEIARLGAAPDIDQVQDTSVIERNESAMILMAYPVAPALYGAHELDALDDVMRGDARQIRDVVYSPSSYLAGQSLASVTIEDPDRSSEHVWFQPFTVELIYTEAQSL